MELNNSTKLKANELRLGNYLTHFGNVAKLIGMTWRGGDVDDYSIHDLVFDNGDYEASIKNCNGIPLDEELLLKCGFVKGALRVQDDRTFCEQEPANLYYDFDDGEIQIRIKDSDYGYWIKCKSLHQPQNVVYFLTGKELEVKL